MGSMVRWTALLAALLFWSATTSAGAQSSADSETEALAEARRGLAARRDGRDEEAREARSSRVAVWGELPDPIGARLAASGKIAVRPWGDAPAGLKEDLEAGRVAQKLTVPVTLGTFALFGLTSLAVATFLADRIPKTVWRAIHATAFGTYLLALAHGVFAGSETQVPAVRALYLGTAAMLVAAFVQRVLLSLRPSTSKDGTAP